MGIQIKGQNDNITSTDGSLEITGITTFNTQLDIGTVVKLGSAGIVTASNFKTGISNLHDVGLTLTGGQLDVGSNIKIGNAGVVTATSFVGSLSGGSVSGTSGAFTGNLDVNSDTSKLKIGAGDDFQFFHNGSNNFIETNNGDIRIKTSDSSGNLTFTAGGSTESARITSTGQLVVGNNPTVDTNTNLHVEEASGECGVVIEGNTGGAGAYLLLRNNSTSSTPRTYIGGVDASGQGTSQIDFHNLNDSNNEGKLVLSTRPSGGSMQERVIIGSDGKVDVIGGYIARNPSDSFTLNGVNTPHYGFQLNASSTVPIAMAGYYGISFATTGVERFRIEKTTGDVTVNTGNLIIGTSGKGIDFSATANAPLTGASMSNELLDDYEEGTWTPSGFCDGGSVSVQEATYTKIGRVVYVYMYISNINIPNTACQWKLYGLPFTVKASGDHYPPLSVGYSGAGNLPAEIRFLFRANTNWIYSHSTAGTSTSPTNQGIRAYIQGQALLLSGFYFTD